MSHTHLFCFIISLFLGFLLGIFSTTYLKTFSLSSVQVSSLFFPENYSMPPSSSPSAPLSSSSDNTTTLSSSSSDNTTTLSKKDDEFASMHNMSDAELFERASLMVPQREMELKMKRVPKVAFLFLAHGQLPLAPLWEKYFDGHQGFYSIYVHSHPSFNQSWPQTSVFYGTTIPSQPVRWGTTSMVDAERRLLGNALLDLSNERFVLLSESCIPVSNFTTAYNYLINSNLSFLSLYDDPGKAGRGRYNPQMSPLINISDWRKGSQWFELNREIAMQIILDQKYYQVFQKYCRPKDVYACYMDEHYIPTLVNMLYPELNSNRSVTWVDWSRGGPHPRKFGWSGDISVELINRIQNGSECTYNENTTSACFLFARKFSPYTLETLLKLAPLLFGFDS